MRNTIILALLISLASGAVIDDIVLTPEDINTKIIIKADAPFVANSFTLKDPSRIIIDCSGVSSTLADKSYAVNRGGIKELSITGFTEQPDLVRVVGKLDRDYSFLTSTEGDDFVLTLLAGATNTFSEWHAGGAEATNMNTAPNPETQPPVVPTQKPSAPVAGRPISCDFEDADILTILRALSEYAGVNIVAGKDVKGTVTVRLHNVPWRRALDIILKASGYAYREDPGVIRVDTADNLDKQDYDLPVSSKIFKLEFAEPDRMLDKVTGMLSPKGKAHVDKRTNSVVVTEVAPVMSRIGELMLLLDTPTPQVEIAVRVVAMATTASRSLGIEWTLEGLESRILRTDVTTNPTPTVAGFGVWNIGTVPSLAQVSMTLNLLEEKGQAQTMAAPRVTAADNEKASVLSGERFGVPTLDISGNTIIQFYEAGTKLEVVPHINSLDEITMEILAEVSELDRASALAGRPIITTSEAESKVLVKDGNTVVIGGFIRTRETQQETGIPLLMDIPLLGFLFKETTTVVEEYELLIFITPTIIKG